MNELWRMDIRSRYGDMDAQAHINNLAYLAYMQECRVQWFLSLDPGDGYESVIINTSIEYLKEIVYPATVTVIMTGGEPGRSSFMTHYEIWAHGDEDYLSARGSAKIVFIDPDKRRSVPMPEVVRNQLSEH